MVIVQPDIFGFCAKTPFDTGTGFQAIPDNPVQFIVFKLQPKGMADEKPEPDRKRFPCFEKWHRDVCPGWRPCGTDRPRR